MNPRAEPPVRSIGTDPAAFTQFYRAHVDDVTRFVARRVADPHRVADLTAQVFVAVIDAAPRYRGSFGGPRTWLYGIARNVIAAEFRRAARERRAESLVAGRRLLDADDVDHLVEKIDAARRVRELHAGLQALPEGERAVLELVAVDGLSVGTAALGVQAFTHSAAAPASAVPGSTVSGAKPGSVHIHTAAFTVDSYSDGTVHVTWNKNQYQDSAGLQQALRAAGFPVLIREGVFCMGPFSSATCLRLS
jgi:RNA polymerase sigma-70 factor (ECF subfamily)